jgi:rubrerythrin
MSKSPTKLRLHKDINRQIKKENYELRMQLQSLEEENKKLEGRLICHEEFHRCIFRELERKLQTKDHVLEPSKSFQEDWKVENINPLMQEKLSPSKCMIKKDDSSYYYFSCQDGEFSRTNE